MAVLRCYRDLPISTLYVANGDEFGTTHCVDMRLNIWHWPSFANKELINSSSVVDTKAG